MIVLSGDVGGTNTRLQLNSFENNQLSVIAKKNYKCVEHQSLTQIIHKFVEENRQSVPKIESVCLAIAGPIMDGKVKFTNLPWSIDREQLKIDLKIQKVELINDFQAIGYGIETLDQAKDMYVMQVGKPVEKGIRVVVGAGTGLGVGFMHWGGSQYVVCPTEGGHISFAPEDDLQMEILRFLRKKYHRVSNERLLSGPGIVQIYSYFRDLDPYNERENSDLRFEMHSGDAAAAITKYALEFQDPIAMQAIDAFVRIYGSRVGDLAYTFMPRGGLYVAGGIAPKILNQMTDGRFMQSYSDKGRLSRILADIPVYVVLNSDVGLQGAALVATRL